MTASFRPTLALLLGALLAGGTPAPAQETAAQEPLAGDPVRGKRVYQRVGYCVDCHGWAGDGKSGRNPRSPDAGASLRDTLLDVESLVLVVRCGRPGTKMPYHEGAAYTDDRCYGATLADYDPADAPIRGKTFREQDARNVVAYLQEAMIGRGEPTWEECAAYFDASADRACAYLKD